MRRKKVKNLPEGTNLVKVKVILPDDVLKAFKAYAGGTRKMWIVGYTMGDFFLSPNMPSKKGSRRLYPIPIGILPNQILNWEVDRVLNS